MKNERDESEREHDWWDPGENFPRLRVYGPRGIVLCCRACGINKREDGRPSSPCKGYRQVELRAELNT